MKQFNLPFFLRRTSCTLSDGFFLFLVIAIILISPGCEKKMDCDDPSTHSIEITYDFTGSWAIGYINNELPPDTISIIKGNHQYEYLIQGLSQASEDISMFLYIGRAPTQGFNLVSSGYFQSIVLGENKYSDIFLYQIPGQVNLIFSLGTFVSCSQPSSKIINGDCKKI